MGVVAPPGLYRRILRTVIKTIEEKGNCRSIRQFSFYFWRCVELHMEHNGDRYYEQLKTPRHIVSYVEPADRGLHAIEASETTNTLAEMHRILVIRSGRQKKSPKKANEPELF
jgi:hypothetical protein